MDEGLYRVDLDSETAKDLAQTGATVLMLGVPGEAGVVMSTCQAPIVPKRENLMHTDLYSNNLE